MLYSTIFIRYYLLLRLRAFIPLLTILRYTSTDSLGNVSTAVRVINVVDTTAPVITVLGTNPINDVEYGSNYSDAGATATDNS